MHVGHFIFNTVIESLALGEMDLSVRQYMWANRHENPPYEKLDRVLDSVEWEHKFPLVSLDALTRSRSNNTPLLVDSGEQDHIGNKAHFSFEISCIGCVKRVFVTWLPENGHQFMKDVILWRYG